MNKRSLAGAAGACLVVLSLAGCGSAQSDWAKASSQNTVSDYQGFITAHPQDSHVAEAKVMISQIQDNNAWQEAQNAGTAASFQVYLRQYPQGTHAADARIEMTGIERAAAWKNTQGVGTAAALQSFLQKYSTGPEVPLAQAKLKDVTGYRLHLAAEPTSVKAQRKLAALKARLGAETPELTVTPDDTGQSFSIDSAGMSEQAAQDVCGSLQKKHVSCQIVSQ